ncbi:uncharacterized protein LOC129288872 isoform X2 [Prosopis cineraria]|uniref:uncharacterized protein LOC129288872 isoform X2 n=1 Tax=Prosopis cineraria TaxID=364024 RepID=UPI0024100930|nr:uncharacterized protein LOC129288872 isoform X2 [Prosopis cineraria]
MSMPQPPAGHVQANHHRAVELEATAPSSDIPKTDPLRQSLRDSDVLQPPLTQLHRSQDTSSSIRDCAQEDYSQGPGANDPNGTGTTHHDMPATQSSTTRSA